MGGARKEKANILGDMVGPAQPIGPNQHVKSSDRLGMFGGVTGSDFISDKESVLITCDVFETLSYFLFSEMATADFRLRITETPGGKKNPPF